MSLLTNLVAASLQPFSNTPIIIAYSGGVDSQVLLHLVYQLKSQNTISNPIQVCHVNHGLSENAEQWQQFAIEQCQRYGLPLTVEQVAIDSKGKGVEAAARDARYQVLTSLSEQPALILTGHHKDDQAETFLLALKRGAGIKGLSAMAELTPVNQHQLLRPLLSASRESIEHYANQHNLSWVEDDSNADTAFDRNFIRHQVLPLLNERWSGFTDCVTRSARLCQQNQSLIEELAQVDFEQLSEGKHTLSIEKLLLLSDARFNNVVRYFAQRYQAPMPSEAQLKQLRKQLETVNDKTPAVKFGQFWFRRFQGALYITADFADVTSFKATIDVCSLAESDEHSIALPDNLGKIAIKRLCKSDDFAELISDGYQIFSCPNDSQLSLTFGHSNPKVLPEYRQHHRPLKKVFQELNIETWQRNRIPLLSINSELILAASYFICQPFSLNNFSNQIAVRWLKPVNSS